VAWTKDLINDSFSWCNDGRTPGAVEYTFSDSDRFVQLTIVNNKFPNNGIMHVYIDGKHVLDIDQYIEDAKQGVGFTTTINLKEVLSIQPAKKMATTWLTIKSQ